MELVNIKIEGQDYQVEKGLTILEAAKKCGYEIPSLCAFNHGECSLASCRVCLVEAQEGNGPNRLVASCVYPVSEGMKITIGSPKATAARRTPARESRKERKAALKLEISPKITQRVPSSAVWTAYRIS